MTGDDQFQVLFSTEDYIQLQKRCQELEVQSQILKEQRTILSTELFTKKQQLSQIHKKYTKIKESTESMSKTGLIMAKKLLEIQIQHGQKQIVQNVDSACGTEQQDGYDLVKDEIPNRKSSDFNLQTQWTVVDNQYYDNEINKLLSELTQSKKVTQALHKKIQQLQKSVSPKQKQHLTILQQKNRVQIQSLKVQIQTKNREIQTMKQFSDERINQNKKMKTEMRVLEDLHKQQQKQIKALNKILSLKKNYYDEIENQKTIKEKGKPKQLQTHLVHIKKLIQKYITQLILNYIQMSNKMVLAQINLLLQAQCKIIQKLVGEVCSNMKLN